MVKKLKIALMIFLNNQKKQGPNQGGESTTPDRFLRSKVDIYVAKLSKMRILTVNIFHKFSGGGGGGAAYKIKTPLFFLGRRVEKKKLWVRCGKQKWPMDFLKHLGKSKTQ